jgi:transposase-like protein
MTDTRAFRGFRFPVSYRDLEAMLAGRGVQVDPEPMEASDERVDSWSLRNRPKEQPDGQRADAGAGHGAGS